MGQGLSHEQPGSLGAPEGQETRQGALPGHITIPHKVSEDSWWPGPGLGP